MNVTKTRKVLMTFLCLSICIGIISWVITKTNNTTPIESGSLIGLLVGSISATINYLLLIGMMHFLVASKTFLAVQAYVARMLIYVLGAFVSVKFGIYSAVTFAASIVAIAVAIFIVYGIGGLKSDD